MIDSEICNVLLPLKKKALDKVHKNLIKDKKQLNIIKASVPEVNVICTFERTFTTLLGYTLQEIAATCGKNVINLDKKSKTSGIDLHTSFGEGQLKSNKNTQTGTHTKDSIKKLLETTRKNQTKPFFAIAFGEPCEYVKNDILYLSGEKFWSKIEINYENLYDTILYVSQETYAEIKSTILPTL